MKFILPSILALALVSSESTGTGARKLRKSRAAEPNQYALTSSYANVAQAGPPSSTSLPGGSSSLATTTNESCLRTGVQPLETNPAIRLSTAQNALIYDYFREHYFNKVMPPLGPQETVTYRNPAYGASQLRLLVAEMLSAAFRVEVDPNQLYGTAGTTAALDTLMRVLQNANGQRNDAIVAAPFWPGFRWATQDLKVNGTLHTFEPEDQTTMQITAKDIEAALKANPSVRFLYICNPLNPLGVIYNKENLEDVYSYVLNNHPDVHIISDEIYAHSVLPEHKDKYVSMLALDTYANATEEQRQRLHWVWGFAKDFGFAGWKVGFVYTKNRDVHSAFDPSYESGSKSIAFISTPISALTDYYLVNFLLATNDYGEKLWSAGMKRYSVELQNSYETTQMYLSNAGITYFPYNYGGQFFWVDLTAEAQAVGGEKNLLALLANKGLALGAGRNYGGTVDGFYRLCYTCYPLDGLEQGLNILVDTVATVRDAEASGRSLRALMSFDVKSALQAVFDPRDPL